MSDSQESNDSFQRILGSLPKKRKQEAIRIDIQTTIENKTAKGNC